MGVLNITPDSFSDGGELFAANQVLHDQLLTRARAMLAAGARVLDVGGESTRPGAEPVSLSEELQRVIPVVQTLRQLDTIISVDTRHAAVAAAAIEAGADLINDIGAGSDPDMLRTVCASEVGYALMHMQGTPANMQRAPQYDDVVAQVRDFLQQRVAACRAAGMADTRLLIDPGFGFGKSIAHNLTLLANLEQLRIDDVALLVGLSRKSTIGAVTGREVDARVHGSVAAALIAAQQGANLIRVHDVGATMDALNILRAVGDAAHASETERDL